MGMYDAYEYQDQLDQSELETALWVLLEGDDEE